MAAEAAAVEVTNLPPSATFDELRAVLGAQAAVFSLAGPQLSALVPLESPDAAQQAVELLHGSEWGGHTLALRPADVGGWLAAHCAKHMPGAATAGLGSTGGGGAGKAAAAAHAQQALQLAAQRAQQAQQAQQAALADAAPRAPGFELPDWGWDQAAGAAQPQQAQQAQRSAAAPSEDAWIDEGWPNEGWESVSGPSGGQAGGAAAGDDDAWQAVGGRASRPAGGVPGASWAGAARGATLDELQGHEVSSTRLLIRNLYPECTQQALLDVFTKYGRLLHAIKQPDRRFAHIEFARPECAAAALRDLHGKLVPELNHQGVLLLQPSLPAGDGDPAATAARAAAMQQRLRSREGGGGSSSGQVPLSDASKGISTAPTPCLWVGSIGGEATSGDVRTVFGRFGALQQWQLEEARLPGKSELKWAIVRYHRTQDAVAAMEELNRKVVPLLGPYPLKLKFRMS